MVSTFYPPFSFGGDGMHVYRLSNALARRGHAIDVFYCEDSYKMLNGKRPVSELPNHPNISLRGLRSGMGFLSPLLTQQTGRPLLKGKLRKALDRNAYDVIHYHNMSLIGITALSLGPREAVKLYTTHEHWLVCPMHVLWKFNREVCEETECLRCQLAGRRPPQLWRQTGLMRKMTEHVDRFLSPSRFTLRKHLEMGMEIPIEQMPYFLPESPAFPNPDEPARATSPYFLFVGRLEYIKGVQNLIPVFKDHPEHRLVIAGGGGYEETLREQAAGIPNIEFLGPVDQERLKELYTAATAVIVPSICYETFGIIIIEAFSFRTPVITNKLGALPEVVEDSGGGIIYENEDELIAAIQRLAADPELRDQLGEKGYDAYSRFWNEEAHLDKYLGLIDRLRIQKKEKTPEGQGTTTKHTHPFV